MEKSGREERVELEEEWGKRTWPAVKSMVAFAFSRKSVPRMGCEKFA
jgi:hypothetical protein